MEIKSLKHNAKNMADHRTSKDKQNIASTIDALKNTSDGRGLIKLRSIKGAFILIKKEDKSAFNDILK